MGNVMIRCFYILAPNRCFEMLVIEQLCSDKIEDLRSPNQCQMELDTNMSGDVIVIKRIYQLFQHFSETFLFWL